MLHCIVSYESVISLECTRSLMDRTEASDAFNAGSIPVGCTLHHSDNRSGAALTTTDLIH